MTKYLDKILIYGSSIAFVLLCCFFAAKDNFYIIALPVFVVVALAYIYAFDKVVLSLAFFTPLAVNVRDLGLGAGLSLPTEPMLFAIMVVYLLRIAYDYKVDKKFLKHPITVIVISSIVWMIISSAFSELPIVSFKYTISRLWFVIPMFFVGVPLFKNSKNFKTFSWLYIAGLSIVIVYTLARHSTYGFSEDAGHWVMDPFYNDHTAYSAALAFFMPVLLFYTFSKYHIRGLFSLTFNIGLVCFYMLAIVFSYGRASWISLVAALMVFIVTKLKIKFRYLFVTAATVIVLFFSFQDQIVDYLEKNKQDSSANFVEHIQSMTNISSDASNLERINRWASSLRMFEERPIFGWGPGTYQFVYGAFQKSHERTIISTNSGDAGNAHSEYLGPLSESGILGLLFVLLLMGYAIYTGLKVYKETEDRAIAGIVMIITLSLITYYVHGILNNFLDTDKLSVPFWAFIAMITSADLYAKKKEVSK